MPSTPHLKMCCQQKVRLLTSRNNYNSVIVEIRDLIPTPQIIRMMQLSNTILHCCVMLLKLNG